MHRWDEDGRWERFRIFLIIFIGLTSISIVYLGIHWFVDIIGGMIIAILAVNTTARTHEPIWRFADERLFNRRLARTLEDPRGSAQRTIRSLGKSLDPIKEPGKNQTGAIILTLIVLTGSVLLWDVTHQKISIEEADSPTSASGSGEWLVWVEESDDRVSITAGNVSSETNRTVGGQQWEQPPDVVSSGTSFVIFNNRSIDYFEHNQESGTLQPIFTENLDEEIVDIAIPTDSEGGSHLAILSSSGLHLVDISDKSTRTVELPANSSVVASSGALVAISEKSESGPLVNITSIDSDLTISILLDPRSSARIEDSIINSGTDLDFHNSTIVDLVMESNWLVATVDVGPFNRTILVDTFSINQTLISNPRWDSSSPSIGDGRVAFLQVTRDDVISSASSSQRKNDVYVHELDSGETKQYTFDEEISQSQPQILFERLAWIEINEEGEKELQLFSFTDTIEPRNSLLLQASILAMIPLIFLWTLQSYGTEKITRRV
jgi:hypothetical protein